ncbi:unnamed protein product [Adineta ricciae]|uniref:ISXO2-like transposase domain-containing protein n=1 Tax=Adineta ricciae TaxID=249248 RepID=A0A816HH40_ADIRI|nr:unnamed protein product [Adineta ricciae]
MGWAFILGGGLPVIPKTIEQCNEFANHDWYLAKLTRLTDGFTFRCRRCLGTKSIRNGTFFELSHLPLNSLFELMYYCSRQQDSLDHLIHELDIGSTKTVVDWKNFCRDVCAEYFLRNPVQIGGPGHIVEIDESCFGKRKYQRGCVLRAQQWDFGGVDLQTKECFMVEVDQRDALTLIPIIQQFIRPGSIIHSDQWRAYNSLQNDPAYVHFTVNHSVNFVDPVTSVHTQNIENSWMRVKCRQKKYLGIHRTLLSSYLQEYMWRQKFGETPFKHLVEQITQIYPV